MDESKLENDLISEIHLEPLQAKVYILVNCHGMMSLDIISEKLNITQEIASDISNQLVQLGAFITLEDKFEAMHPRFTAVNMYRRYCEREDVPFKRNQTVDNIGIILETPYEDARTK